MSRPWSRWSVFEYMKQRFIQTGHVPSQVELEEEFQGIDQTELREGIAEFGTIANGWPELEVQNATAKAD